MYECYSFKKKNTLGIILTVIICTVIASVTAVLAYKMLFTPLPEKEEVVPQGEQVSASPQNEDLKYQKEAEYYLIEAFGCGHNKEFSGNIPESFIGKTIEEIKNENPDIEITAFNDFSISAHKTSSGSCDNHYIIMLSGNRLTAYKKDEPEKILKKLTISTNDFSKEDIEILKNGIEVGSFDEVLEFLEGFAN